MPAPMGGQVSLLTVCPQGMAHIYKGTVDGQTLGWPVALSSTPHLPDACPTAADMRLLGATCSKQPAREPLHQE